MHEVESAAIQIVALFKDDGLAAVLCLRRAAQQLEDRYRTYGPNVTYANRAEVLRESRPTSRR